MSSIERKELNTYLGIVKGSGRGGQHQQRPALGEEGDFAVHASVYGKVQGESNVNPNDQRRKDGERCLFLPRLGCLATYVDYVPYVSLSKLGGGIHPTTVYGLIKLSRDPAYDIIA